MIILHICNIDNDGANGVSNVVPEHFKNQILINKTTGILVCGDVKIEKLDGYNNVFYLNEFKRIADLPSPFNCPELIVFHEVYPVKYISIFNQIRNKYNYIIVPHGCLTTNAQKIKKMKKVIGNFIFYKNFVKNAKYIQYLSEEEKNMSVNWNKKAFICGNGISASGKIKSDFKIDDKINLIYVGRYSVYHKGLDILINGFISNKEYVKKNNIFLNLYGKECYGGTSQLQDLVHNNCMDEVIKFNGPIYGEDKLAKILESDFFIQTSRLEGQPLGVMEALMLGLPVIVSEGTTFSDFVIDNDCGFVCSDVLEFSKMFEQIVKCKRSDELSKLSVNARTAAINSFSWDIIAKKSIDYYRKIINEL
jgi:glycosyltransferase involved in cell wall biosynthesis